MNILTFAAHQAYLHLLGCLTEHRFYALLMPDQRRFLQNWDPRCRPLPQNFRLLERENLSSLLASQHFQLGIAHNLTDLQELIAWKLPVVMVFHASLSGRMVEENTAIDPDQMRVSVNQLCRHHGVTQIFVTELKRSDWQANGIVIEHGLNLADYGPYEGEKPFVLRVANHLAERGTLLRYDFHQAVTAGLPITLLGENPSLRIQPAASWTDLRRAYTTHRVYLHTAQSPYEDGYNLALLEAMASGMPVVGNAHPTSPVMHGDSGFLSDDVAILRGHIRSLLKDRDMACEMGQKARSIIADRFGQARFKSQWQAVLDPFDR